MINATRIFETVLYAEDLPAAKRFYSNAMGLEVITSSELVVSLRCGENVLLIFDPRRSGVAGRPVPSHGSSGAGHIAFAATEEELDEWRRRLAAHEVEIEMEVEWESGGRSIYVRDPAGNSVELAPMTLWRNSDA